MLIVALPPLIGIRGTFWLAGGVIFLTFIATTVFIKEDKRPASTKKETAQAGWSQIPDKRPVVGAKVLNQQPGEQGLAHTRMRRCDDVERRQLRHSQVRLALTRRRIWIPA